MTSTISAIISEMVNYNQADPGRVQHALKVYAFAKAIGEREEIAEKTREILEIAAVLHDIGIRNSERKYGSADGKHQELEGPPVAREMLESMSVSEDVIDRVCFLIGHHHTYTQIEGIDYQILIEADFLVNLYEDNMSQEQARTVLQKYFKTETGKEYLTAMYLKQDRPGSKSE
jgi:HD superfamily phosphodiesterase